jgi:hypothetical protein
MTLMRMSLLISPLKENNSSLMKNIDPLQRRLKILKNPLSASTGSYGLTILWMKMGKNSKIKTKSKKRKIRPLR